jgi:glycosyltransferase involved in cell wall biosynthesis
MRIAIDYTSALVQGAGIGRYTRNLVAALAQLESGDRYTLFSTEAPTAERPIPTAPNVRSRVVPVGNRRATILWHRLRVPLPAELVMGRADVLHGPDFTLPPAIGARRVVTIHDLAFLTHPECALPSLVTYLSRVVPRALHRADRVIAVSQRTATDLIERLDVPAERIAVIHLGVDPSFEHTLADDTVAEACARLGLATPFVLAVGTIEPRKNYERLIAAFARIARETAGPRMLVIAGRKGWLYEGVFAAAQRYGVAEQVRFLDYVADGDLRTLYRAAAVLAMPSLYEGFGIPLLEAMASETPIVCSTAGSLPEVAADAGLLVPPEDTDALAEALLRVVREPALAASLVARGHERVKAFTWQAAAQAHVRVYHEAAKHA